MTDNDETFERRIRNSLDDSVRNLDAESRSRLAAIRNETLAQKPALPSWFGFGQWLPASAVAATLLMVVALMTVPTQQQQTTEPLALADAEIALELLSADDDLADPDFYVWMDAALLEEELPDHAS